jgi:hypothetical protein
MDIGTVVLVPLDSSSIVLLHIQMQSGLAHSFDLASFY